MKELVEVLSNPRTNTISLSHEEIRKAMAKPKKRRKAKAKPKKRRKTTKRKSAGGKVDFAQVAMGAAIASALEMGIVRNKKYAAKLPAKVRQYSGAILALVGYMMAVNKKGPAKNRAMGAGVLAVGVFVTVQDQVAKAKAEQVVTIAEKIAADVLAWGKDGVKGLGSYDASFPVPPYMSAAAAAASLGLQPRMPYQPHGTLGELVQLEGLGDVAMMPSGPTNYSDNAKMRGLGDIVPSDPDGWLRGQFAGAGDDWRSEGWG